MSNFDFPAIERLFDRFKNIGLVIPKPQREMYEAIKNEIVVNDVFRLKKTVCDIGCGVGVGSNILSQEAKFVWGIDKSEKTINFAKQMFERRFPQITFDVVDITNFPRETMRFDIITMIEVIEHIPIADYQNVFNFIKRMCKNNTVVYISTPNRNNLELLKRDQKNKYHFYEFSPPEFYDILIKNFKSVMLYNHTLTKDVDLDTTETPLLAKCIGVL